MVIFCLSIDSCLCMSLSEWWDGEEEEKEEYGDGESDMKGEYNENGKKEKKMLVYIMILSDSYITK